MRKLILAIFLIVVLLPGCNRHVTPSTPTPPDEERNEMLPADIQDWIEDSKTMFLAQSKKVDNSLYLLVTYGEKPTGGYSVEIGEVVVTSDKISVQVVFKRPAPGEIVTQALDYPYDLKILEVQDLPVEFLPSGDEEYLPTLMGIDELLPIVAGTAGVKIFAPAPESVVSRSFVLEGVANVFEGNVLYKLRDTNGRILDSGFTTGAMGLWGYFRTELTVPEDVAAGELLLLDVFTTSAKDGSIQEQIEYEITLQN